MPHLPPDYLQPVRRRERGRKGRYDKEEEGNKERKRGGKKDGEEGGREEREAGGKVG